MMLLTYEAVFPQDLKTIFDAVVDLEHAPVWHTVHSGIVQTRPGKIGPKTTWRINYKTGQTQAVWITEWELYECVRFQAANLGGIEPVFTIRFEAVDTGTRVEYTVEPIVHPLLKLPVSMFAPYFGKRDLGRYFGELGEMLTGEM